MLPNFLYMLPVAMARPSSNGSAICYLLPVLWMTSCFHVIERLDRIRDDAYVSSNSPVKKVIRLPIAGICKCDFSYIFAAVDKISTDKARRAVPLR